MIKKCNLFGAIAVIMLVTLEGCSISDDYCCTSNDQCVPVHGKDTFCTTAECGKCEVPEEPLQLSVTAWKDPTVGEPYNVELTASGGFSSYDWVELAKVNDGENKLVWLVLEKDPKDPSKAYLRNGNNNGQSQLPSNPTTPSDKLTIKVTVADSTRHVTDVTKVDKSIAVFIHEIRINDCERPCAVIGPTKCDIDKLYHCESYFGDCTKWVETVGQCTSKRCKNNKIDCCVSDSGKDLCGDLEDTRCKDGWIQKCSEDNESRRLFYINYEQCQNGCNTDGSSCKDCMNECTKSGDRQCSIDNSAVNTCSMNTEGCLIWMLYKQCNGGQKCNGSDCSCLTGCWDGSKCQDGNTMDICGTGGASCVKCENVPDKYCLASCADGKCIFRYTIQDNGEVRDATTGLYWKRQIESGRYSWDAAKNQCATPYQLPDLDQLKNIIELHEAPLININSCAFPGTPFDFFWSSYSYGTDASNAWGVNFGTGIIASPNRTYTGSVRCVRLGP